MAGWPIIQRRLQGRQKAWVWDFCLVYTVLSRSDGKWYEGLWKNGKRHGIGTYFDGNSAIEAEWDNDKMVRRI